MAAIVVNNNQGDTILINQLSYEDAVVLEATTDNSTIIIASMYLDIIQPIDIDMLKIDATIAHAKGAAATIAVDRKS